MTMNFRKLINRARNMLLLISGLVTIALAILLKADSTPYIYFMHKGGSAEFKEYQMIIIVLYGLLIVSSCCFLYLAGSVILRRNISTDSDSIETGLKSAWPFNSISVQTLHQYAVWFVVIAVGAFLIYQSSFNSDDNSGAVTAAIQVSSQSQAKAKLMGGAIQGTTLNLTAAISTLAIAETPSATKGVSSAASFNQPRGIATDGSNLYVADSENNKIRKIVISSGMVTTLAGSGTAGSADGKGTAASFDTPRDIIADGNNLYVADSGNDIIRKIIISTGEVSTLAGTAKSSGAADGTGAAASFFYPRGITTDGSNLYVADSGNHKIRKIVIATGAVTTLAGSETSGSSDGTGSAASFNGPEGIATDRSNLYVADTYNHKIRKILIATGAVTTLAGKIKGFADGKGATASFNQPTGITIDGGNLYVADNGNNTFRMVVASSGEVVTPEDKKIAPKSRYSRANAEAPADENFYKPYGIATDGRSLFVSDASYHTIRKISIATQQESAPGYNPWGKEIITLAGTGAAGSVDNAVVATDTGKEVFSHPAGVTTDGINLYVADSENHTIRKIIIATGEVITLAGLGATGSVDATGVKASFNQPAGLTTDGSNIFVADTENHVIRKIVISTTEVTTLTGSGTQGSLDGTGAAASFSRPFGITTDGGNLFVTDTANHIIRKIVIATGKVTTLAGSNAAGSVDATGATASFSSPRGITTDGSNLYVADSENNKIRKIVIATGVVTTLAGSGAAGFLDGAASAASFISPRGITTDGINLYVADSGNNKIRKIVIATGAVTTLSGSGAAGYLDAAGAMALFHSPQGITTDGKNLYVADTDNHKIRKIK